MSGGTCGSDNERHAGSGLHPS